MNNKFLQLKALKQIIDEKKSFQSVLENIVRQNNLSENDKVVFKLDVLGSLRHFYQLQYEATKEFPEFMPDDDEIYLIIIALYEFRYHSKDLAGYEVINQTTATIKFMSLRLDSEQVKNKLEEITKKKFVLPEDLKKDLYAYNALFFNTPKWIIELLTSEYGDDICMNFLLSSQRKGSQYLAINTIYRKIEDFSNDVRFIHPQVLNTALEYQTGKCSNLIEVKKGDLFPQDLSTQIMLNSLNYCFKQKTLHIGAKSGSIMAEVAIRIHDNGGYVDALFSNDKKYSSAKYLSRRLGLDNTHIFYGSLKMMKTYSPYNSYDMVIYSPNSSKLGQVRRRPDIFPTLQKEDIFKYCAKSSIDLNEVKKFVASDSYLIYHVPTITKEETTNIIKDFLSKNDDFILEYERQIFPYEYGSDGLYFAVLKKIK